MGVNNIILKQSWSLHCSCSWILLMKCFDDIAYYRTGNAFYILYHTDRICIYDFPFKLITINYLSSYVCTSWLSRNLYQNVFYFLAKILLQSSNYLRPVIHFKDYRFLIEDRYLSISMQNIQCLSGASTYSSCYGNSHELFCLEYEIYVNRLRHLLIHRWNPCATICLLLFHTTHVCHLFP